MANEGGKDPEELGRREPDRVLALLEERAAEDPTYDEEALTELKENLDPNRRESGAYRMLFGGQRGG